MTFYDRLTELRKKSGKTQKEVQDDLRLNKNSFGIWKTGKIPVQSTQLALAQYFGVSVDYLMGRTDTVPERTTNIKAYHPYEKRGSRPVIGIASAGMGVIADEQIIDWESVDDKYNKDNFFWIEVSGDSMSPKILDGDRVLVQQDGEIHNGDIAVAIVDSTEGYLKQVFLGENTITLHSQNTYYPDMVFSGTGIKRVTFNGKVKELKRCF